MDKKVLIVVRHCTGGMKKHLSLILEGLKGKNFLVYLAGPKEAFSEKDLKSVEKFLDLKIEESFFLNGCLKALILTINFIKKENIKLVHSHGILATLICALAKGFCRIKLVATLHNIPRKYPFFINFIFGKCDIIISVSEAIKKELVFNFNINQDKIYVIHNSLPNKDIEKLLFPSRPLFFGGVKIFCSSRLIYEKGVDVLIKSAKILIDDLKLSPKDIQFYIAGSGPEEKCLKRLTQKLNLNNHVVFLGYIENVYEVLKNCDILVLPSRKEGFGISILEAFILKKPVIASSTGGILELINDNENGLLFESQNPKSLALCLKKLINNPGLALKLAEAGYKTSIKNFNYETMIEKLVKCYEKLM